MESEDTSYISSRPSNKSINDNSSLSVCVCVCVGVREHRLVCLSSMTAS